MRLFHIIKPDYWEACHAAGGIFPDPDRLHYGDSFAEAYAWMRAQMARRIPDYSGEPPVWAWFKRPDLRSRHGTSGAAYMLLTLEVPESRVLLSHFGEWHNPLNGMYVPTVEENRELERLAEASYEEWDEMWSRLNGCDQAARHASWERIFDLEDAERRWPGYNPRQAVQACIDRVFLHEVVHVRPFTAR